MRVEGRGLGDSHHLTSSASAESIAVAPPPPLQRRGELNDGVGGTYKASCTYSVACTWTHTGSVGGAMAPGPLAAEARREPNTPLSSRAAMYSGAAFSKVA